MNFEAPSRLIDRERGEVWLRLCPFYLPRLHGPWPAGQPRDRTALLLGLPFPFLPGVVPIDVCLRGGMKPEEIDWPEGLEPNSSLGQTSWWRWSAFALTPFGWSAWPTPFFERGHLSSLKLGSLKLGRNGHDEGESFTAMEEWLVRELGPPTESDTQPEPTGSRWPVSRSEVGERFRHWSFSWGEVALYFELRDWRAEMSIRWR